jgi:hypothetical protein
VAYGTRTERLSITYWTFARTSRWLAGNAAANGLDPYAGCCPGAMKTAWVIDGRPAASHQPPLSAPDWLASQYGRVEPARYGPLSRNYRLPHTKPERLAYAQQKLLVRTAGGCGDLLELR